ncbi:MAG: hypothetical protein ABW184_08835 [Sphingobium sp.]
MQHRTISGKILYTSRKPGREGQERGREQFTWTIHGDGSRTIRALCEIDEPDPTVLRDVTCSFGADDRPTDCFVRLTIGDRFMGAGIFAASHFRFTDPDAQAHPDYDIWVTADDDALFLNGGVGGYMQTWYELTELTRR